jgi:hypothetical protein
MHGLQYIPVPKSPGDVSWKGLKDVFWIKLREVCTSEQKLEEVFIFRVAVYRPDDKTTKCFLSTGGNRRFWPLAQGYWLPGTKDIQALFFDIVVAMMDWFIVHKKG